MSESWRCVFEDQKVCRFILPSICTPHFCFPLTVNKVCSLALTRTLSQQHPVAGCQLSAIQAAKANKKKKISNQSCEVFATSSWHLMGLLAACQKKKKCAHSILILNMLISNYNSRTAVLWQEPSVWTRMYYMTFIRVLPYVLTPPLTTCIIKTMHFIHIKSPHPNISQWSDTPRCNGISVTSLA